MPTIEPFYFMFGRLLRETRERVGLSQEQLGAKLTPRMTRASIANMESGKQRVLAKTLVDLAVALNVEVTTLLPGHQLQPQARRGSLRAELGAVLDLPEDKLKELTKQLERTPKR